MRLVLACLALLALGGYAHAATVFATPSTLPAVLASAKPGDTIYLAGQFEGPRARDKAGLTFKCQADAPLTSPQRPTTLAGWYWRNGKDLTFDGCPFLRSPVNGFGLRFDGIDGLTITRSAFDGIELRLAGPCKRVDITESRFVNSGGQGISATNCDGVKVTRSLFRGSSSDGIQCASCVNVEIAFNRFDGTVPAPGAHPDCIQFFLSPNGVQTAHVLIQGNVCEGRTQGFSSFDGRGISDLRIIDNTVALSDYKWAVSAWGSKGVVIEGNSFRILPGVAFPTKRALGIDVRGGSEPIKFGGNVMSGCKTPEKCTVY